MPKSEYPMECFRHSINLEKKTTLTILFKEKRESVE